MTELNLNFAQSIDSNITFEQAISKTESFLDLLSSGSLTEEEITNIVTLLVMSENGARGFFVAYLTTHKELADHPCSGVINALKSSPEIVGELLVKNLAMSTATAITHRRNNDQDLAEGSDQVQRRTLILIKQVASPEITKKLSILAETLKNNQGEYQSFVTRWGYDDQQKEAILIVIPI